MADCQTGAENTQDEPLGNREVKLYWIITQRMKSFLKIYVFEKL